MKVSSWELEEKLCAMKDVKLPSRMETTWLVIISWHLCYQIGIVGCVHSFFLYCHSFLPWECRWHWFKNQPTDTYINPIGMNIPSLFCHLLGKMLETHILGMYPRLVVLRLGFIHIYTLNGASPIFFLGSPKTIPRTGWCFRIPISESRTGLWWQDGDGQRDTWRRDTGLMNV